MARIRSIKPELPSDRLLGSLPIGVRLTFVYLITQADDYGLVPGEPRQLLGLLFPHNRDITETELEGWITCLANAERVQRLTTTDGSTVLRIVRWERHQRVDNRRGSSPLLAALVVADRERILAEIAHTGTSPRTAAKHPTRTETSPLGVGVGVGTGAGEGTNTSAPKRGEEQWVADFEAVWPLYPRRPNNSRSSALAAYLAARRGHKPKGRPPITPATAEELRAGVEAYAAYCRRENVGPQFVKLAATFFGPGEHWRTDYGVVENPTAGFPPEVMACRNPDGTFRLCDDLGNPTAAARWMVR